MGANTQTRVLFTSARLCAPRAHTRGKSDTHMVTFFDGDDMNPAADPVAPAGDEPMAAPEAMPESPAAPEGDAPAA